MKSKDAIKFFATVLPVAMILAFVVDQLLEKDRLAFRFEVKELVAGLGQKVGGWVHLERRQPLVLSSASPSVFSKQEEAIRKLQDVGVVNPLLECQKPLSARQSPELSEVWTEVCPSSEGVVSIATQFSPLKIFVGFSSVLAVLGMGLGAWIWKEARSVGWRRRVRRHPRHSTVAEVISNVTSISERVPPREANRNSRARVQNPSTLGADMVLADALEIIKKRRASIQ